MTGPALPSLSNAAAIKRRTIVTAVVAILLCYVPVVIWTKNNWLPFVIKHEDFSSSSSVSSIDVSSARDAINSATGKLFKGERVRTFPSEQKKFVPNRFKLPVVPKATKRKSTKPKCDRWNVVTTIFDPSEAVKRAANVAGWCTVIVADTKTPTNYVEVAGFEGMEATVHYLSVQDQEEWLEKELSLSSAVGAFLKAIPYKHFARKNVGFLYAIQQGANFIFDFDDDNLLPINSKGVVTSPLEAATISVGQEHKLPNTRLVSSKTPALNHHPLMGATVNNSWARGFPLQDIQNKQTQGKVVADDKDIEMTSIAVMQFCANGNPDIDAVHRLVHPLPMTFETTTTPNSNHPLNVPSGTFVPYNAQATLHTRQAMWALFLPFTVPGRVSDIWRGYFAEALFGDLGLTINFLPPAIVQDRNEHHYLADMQAELDLYFKAGVLIDYLSAWNSTAESIPERMEELWVDLYERNYIEINDVKVIQLWLAALVEVGYNFPSFK
jgi:STELLO glycosyltransferases